MPGSKDLDVRITWIIRLAQKNLPYNNKMHCIVGCNKITINYGFQTLREVSGSSDDNKDIVYMPRTTQADITGDTGVNMAQLLLSHVALVNRFEKDIGLDLHCELRTDLSYSFYVQAKGSANPKYTETTINALPVECKTVEQYWLKKQPSPVFVFMSDIIKNRTYYTVVDRNTYRPRQTNQKKYTFSIPLTNEITFDNISIFVACVIENRFNITKEERERFIQDHFKKNPELFRGLTEEKDGFLEIMRGSDQTAQVEVKMLLKQRYEEGIPIPGDLRSGLISIFINSKDRITQSHTLDTLVYINETAVVPQVIRQIDRNIRSYEYLFGDGPRSHHTDFLF